MLSRNKVRKPLSSLKRFLEQSSVLALQYTLLLAKRIAGQRRNSLYTRVFRGSISLQIPLYYIGYNLMSSESTRASLQILFRILLGKLKKLISIIVLWTATRNCPTVGSEPKKTREKADRVLCIRIMEQNRDTQEALSRLG